MFYVYVLSSANFNKIYIGFSSDVDGRVNAHNHPSNKGWTKDFKPWQLIHSECFEIKHAGMSREKQLKSQKGREYIREELLKSF